MSGLPGTWLVHTVTVEPQTGEGAYGNVYGPAVTVPCFQDDQRQLVRNSTGTEVVSETTIYCQLDTAPLFPLDSRVTLADGTVAYVLNVKRRDEAGRSRLEHLEVTL